MPRKQPRTAYEDLSPLERLPDEILVEVIFRQLPALELLRLEQVCSRFRDRVREVFRRRRHLQEAQFAEKLFDGLFKDPNERSWRVNNRRKKLLDGLYRLLEKCPNLEMFDFSYKFFLNQGSPHQVGVKLARLCPNLTEIKLEAFVATHCNVARAYGSCLKGKANIRTLYFLDNKFETTIIRQHVNANVRKIVNDFPKLEHLYVGSLYSESSSDVERLLYAFLRTSNMIKTVTIRAQNFQELVNDKLSLWNLLDEKHQQQLVKSADESWVTLHVDEKLRQVIATS